MDSYTLSQNLTSPNSRPGQQPDSTTVVFTPAGIRLISHELHVTPADVGRFEDAMSLLESLVLDAGYPDGCCWVTERWRVMQAHQRAWLYVNNEECANITPASCVDARQMLALLIVAAAIR